MQDGGSAELLAIGATPEQKDRWLWPLLAGKLRSAYSMTERDVAGSDPTLIRTTAVRDGDEWVINGHKWFTSNGSAADFLIVMCRTNPDVPAYQGCSRSRKRMRWPRAASPRMRLRYVVA